MSYSVSCGSTRAQISLARGQRVRLEQRAKNLKPLLDRAAADGYTGFAFVTAGSTVDAVEIKPLG